MGDAEYPRREPIPSLSEANVGLVTVINEARKSTDFDYANEWSNSLNWAFETHNRVGQKITFSHGRYFVVADGVNVGGSMTPHPEKPGPVNGAVKTQGIFKRFDILEAKDELFNSGRNIFVYEVCLVCADDTRSHFPVREGQEIYYPIVNLGDEGLQFDEQ